MYLCKLVPYTVETLVSIQWHPPYANHPQEKTWNLQMNLKSKNYEKF